MQDLNDLYYFAKVVEAGGFAAAGRVLGIPKSRLSRRIAELETRLNASLLQRTTRKLALTAVGERYLQHCQAMLLEADMADEAVASLSAEPRGRLRVSCPVGLIHWELSNVVSDFVANFPQVQLEMLLVNRRVDLVNEGIDVALRVRDIGDEDPSLIVRNLAPTMAVLVAAPVLLLDRIISTPQDLASLPVLGAIEADRKVHYQLVHRNGTRCEMSMDARLAIDDFPIRKTAALRGLGFSMLPLMNCREELADGRLVQLLPDWSLPGGHLQAAYTQRRGTLPAVRAWIDHISAAFTHDTGDHGCFQRQLARIP
ncbi:LysR substrate-binding domain-containing protein [Pseudomonas sp. 10B1]|uniref:LysR substrate-binding domain-containing protein n=1 Tax=unclassified Pseudomonas TaxID=196821 RepID=UPI002AB51F59|nr:MULTISPECIES: LysR substrate-binding domain-containing protein [unclassified Pseudomonas]MDY7560314.1 LysR substrate-binding domain-containing protein [Pseudomonas sp. AB6]MEA9975571.1 LysR substrate-binding domain-containing protein [Pseudomonas sp. RTS4]MEA9993944.1 LysR substrate-binding domain-containing protein [Pseudomonas sp. AA4]MEB0085376.1 LysR substrate-binding domain-containing protein [Pseudomonas sp. RTI1]MEB0124438.1 LysR substrate-binding domain-containing protein [Pseudomon